VAWANVRPSVLVRAAGIPVGLVGVTTSGTLKATIAANTIGLAIAPLAPTIVAEAARLRADGAAAVIVVAHAGGRCTRFEAPDDSSSCQAESEIGDVVSKLPRGTVDAIVAGHTHAGMAHEIGGVPIIESFSSGRAFGRIDLTLTRDRPRVLGHRIFRPHEICEFVDGQGRCAEQDRSGAVRERYEGAEVRPSPSVDAVLSNAVAVARQVKARPIGIELVTSIKRAHGRESALGNLFASAMLESVPGADAALTNGGGLRADLPAGPLTWGSLYEAMPFDNRLVRLRLTGRELSEVLARNLVTTHGSCRSPALRPRLAATAAPCA
jgi:5'-nucleotidase